ncbi:hypothetical protein ID866_3254 [Astraeus odoratus]|nr:hypothetical protein ID866_3254 [Astraeus odoratus]
MGLLPRRSTPLSSAPTSRSLPVPRPSGVSTSASAAPPARQARERAKPYAAVRLTPRPAKQATGPKHHMSRERNADLRTAYAEGIELRRWFRDGELLWCTLNPPIPGLNGEKEAITFWPGLVEEAKIKSEAVPRQKVDGSDAVKKDESGASITSGSQPRDCSPPAMDLDPSKTNASDDKEVPWKVVQTLWYKIKLLGIPYSCNIRADQVLPYQAHAPSDELIQAIHRVPLEQMDIETDSFKPSPTAQFGDAAASFALAVQIAANLAGFWSPTDDWVYKFTIHPSPPANLRPAILAPKPANGGMSLDSVMNASMAYNASLSKVASDDAQGSGSTPAPPILTEAQIVSQTRFQGLWWGAERIWTDELVRLKLSRSQIAPQGAESILPPAGPSRKAIEYARSLDDGSDDSENITGAAARGVFMLIEGLYVADVPKVNGSVGKECRATGMIYELVDEDWEEDTNQGSGSPVNGGKWKGKGKAVDGSGASATPANASSISVSIGSPSGSQLVNPDPTVPVEKTTSSVVSLMDSVVVSTKSKTRNPNEQLSRPVLSSPFPLPPPPEGFKFRPILTPGHEAVISLNLIAGRYYPRLLQHPLLDSCVEKALDIEGGGLVEASQLWALEGLSPGFYNTMDPVKWRASRVAMVREADADARQGLQEHWRTRAREREEKQAMDASYLPLDQLPDGVQSGAISFENANGHGHGLTPVTNPDAMEVEVDA